MGLPEFQAGLSTWRPVIGEQTDQGALGSPGGRNGTEAPAWTPWSSQWV